MALANISLDLLGQARGLYPHIGELDGTGRSEDDFAMLRDERQWRNVHLVEQERADFGFEMARLLWFSAYQVELYAAAAVSSDETFRAVAAKATKEVAYHHDHAHQWVVRLGDGTDESRERMQAALEAVLPYLAELFDDDPVSTAAAEAGSECCRRRSTTRSWVVCRGRRRGHAEPPERLALALARRPAGRPFGADGVPPRRDAARRALTPGGDVVTTTRTAPSSSRRPSGASRTPRFRSSRSRTSASFAR